MIGSVIAYEKAKEYDNRRKVDVVQAVIENVVDGDTYDVITTFSKTRVRLIGVDTPDSVNPDTTESTPEGKTAADFAKELLPEGTTVYLEYDVGERDEYGRHLCYVYLENGVMVNALLLRKGMAKTMTIPPNVKYSEEFAKIQTQARENGEGFWSIWEE